MEVVEVRDKSGKVYKVYMDEITYGQRCRVLERVTKGKIAGGIEADVDLVELERQLVIESIMKIEPEPSKTKDEFINELPISQAVKLISKAVDLNPLGV